MSHLSGAHHSAARSGVRPRLLYGLREGYCQHHQELRHLQERHTQGHAHGHQVRIISIA